MTTVDELYEVTLYLFDIFLNEPVPRGVDPAVWRRLDRAAERLHDTVSRLSRHDPDERARLVTRLLKAERLCLRLLEPLDRDEPTVAHFARQLTRVCAAIAVWRSTEGRQSDQPLM